MSSRHQGVPTAPPPAAPGVWMSVLPCGVQFKVRYADEPACLRAAAGMRATRETDGYPDAVLAYFATFVLAWRNVWESSGKPRRCTRAAIRDLVIQRPDVIHELLADVNATLDLVEALIALQARGLHNG